MEKVLCLAGYVSPMMRVSGFQAKTGSVCHGMGEWFIISTKIQAGENADSLAEHVCAETISRGGKVVTWLIGHFMASQNRMPGTPSPFTILGNEDVLEQLREKLGRDDVFLLPASSW